MIPDDRVPVLVPAGQVTNRGEPLGALDLAERAAADMFDRAPGLRRAVERVSVVGILSPVGPSPATALARRLGLTATECETTTVGGNTPQLLVTRAAAEIAAGRLSATLIAGAEALRSVKSGLRSPAPDALEGADPQFGDERLGTTDAEHAVGLILPLHIYAMFECAVAARHGRSLPDHRTEMGRLLAPFSEVAAGHPCAWFREPRTPESIARPSSSNRLVSEPYTKLMTSFLEVDQGAAVVVCSLAAARAAGVADGAVFVWSGADCHDVWDPAARPDVTRSPAIAAAAGATLEPHGLGVDDVDSLDLYSCFPVAVEAAADALALKPGDPRGLTVTGGLAHFGGPGNNYSTHAIATMAGLLAGGDGHLGLVGALGWYNTKHSYGLYGTVPPPAGFVMGDTTTAQAEIDASGLPVVLQSESQGMVAAWTAACSGDTVTAAPAIISLDDGSRLVAAAAEVPQFGGTSAVGARVRVSGTPPVYSLID